MPPPDAPRWFDPILPGAGQRARLIGGIAAGIGILASAAIFAAFDPGDRWPILVAPMGASAVLLFAVPASPLAQPWPMIGGNIVSALVGAAVIATIGTGPLAAGCAVGLAILAMSVLRCLHPPGGAAALSAVIGGPAVLEAGPWFALWPIGINAGLLLATGMIFHRIAGNNYPHRGPALADTEAFAHADIDGAIDDLGESLDVDRDDLAALLVFAERRAQARRAVPVRRTPRNRAAR